MSPFRSISLMTTLVLVATTLLVSNSAADTEADLEQTFTDLRTAYYEAETPAEKLVVVKKFLEEYLESKYTAGVLGAGTYLLSEEMGDHAGAVDYARDILAQVKDPETAAGVRLVMVDLYGHPEYAADLTTLAADMTAAGQNSFSDHLAVIKAAANAEAWELTLQQVKVATPLASAEAFQADYPDEEFDQEYLQQAGRNRQGLMGTFRGWALANQGDTDAALRSFSESEGLVKFSYLGVPENDLYFYWGKARLANNETDEALKMLSQAAIWGYSEEAMQAAREVYTSQKGSEDGFEDYLWQLRKGSAQILDNFTLNDYEDQPRSFSDLKGKVTLLAFWFPT